MQEMKTTMNALTNVSKIKFGVILGDISIWSHSKLFLKVNYTKDYSSVC